MMNVISQAYLKQLEAAPAQQAAVIITTRTRPALHVERATALGLTVTQTFSLISALAAYGPAEAVLAVAQEPWVARIEPDQIVKAL